jgi:hypothetical protein
MKIPQKDDTVVSLAQCLSLCQCSVISSWYYNLSCICLLTWSLGQFGLKDTVSSVWNCGVRADGTAATQRPAQPCRGKEDTPNSQDQGKLGDSLNPSMIDSLHQT